MVCSNAKEHGEQRKGKVGVREESTEGAHGAASVGTRRHAGREDGQTDWGTYAAEREGRYEHRTWWIGWNQRFGGKSRIWRIGWRQGLGKHRRVWWIGWGQQIETIRRVWRTGRRRWSMWKGRACSKWRSKSSMTTKTRRTRLPSVAENLASFSPYFGTYRWMCMLGGGGCREDFRP